MLFISLQNYMLCACIMASHIVFFSSSWLVMKPIGSRTREVLQNGIRIHLELQKDSRGELTVHLNHPSLYLMRALSSLAGKDIEAPTTDLNGATKCISREPRCRDKCDKLM